MKRFDRNISVFNCVPKYLSPVCYMLSIILTILLVPVFVSGEDMELEDMRAMSLKELLQVKVSVPAALTKLTHAETPGSITVITAEDIRLTPARNIYDLIEVYVPGAIWMNYEEGLQLGIRGIIANQNYKYLLRVNGRLMNNNTHFGAKSGFEQWDMSDTQRIEIFVFGGKACE